MAIDKEQRVQLFGSAESVVEVFDNWEGMRLCGIRFGAFSDGEVHWAGDHNAVDWEMARALANELLRLADEHAPLEDASC